MQHTARRSFGDNGVPANGNETTNHSTEEKTMSTKTTDDVRRAYEDCHKDGHELNYGEYTGQQGKFQRLRDEFDAWLAAHDSEVAAKALEQAALIAVRIREDYWDEKTEAAISRIVDAIRASEAGPS